MRACNCRDVLARTIGISTHDYIILELEDRVIRNPTAKRLYDVVTSFFGAKQFNKKCQAKTILTVRWICYVAY